MFQSPSASTPSPQNCRIPLGISFPSKAVKTHGSPGEALINKGLASSVNHTVQTPQTEESGSSQVLTRFPLRHPACRVPHPRFFRVRILTCIPTLSSRPEWRDRGKIPGLQNPMDPWVPPPVPVKRARHRYPKFATPCTVQTQPTGKCTFLLEGDHG